MEKWCQCASDCMSVLLAARCDCVCVRTGLHVLACSCFLSGRRPAGDKEKVKAERTADGVGSAYIV